MYLDYENDPMDQVKREMGFAMLLLTLVFLAFVGFIIFCATLLLSGCGATKEKHICPAYKVYEKKH